MTFYSRLQFTCRHHLINNKSKHLLQSLSLIIVNTELHLQHSQGPYAESRGLNAEFHQLNLMNMLQALHKSNQP